MRNEMATTYLNRSSATETLRNEGVEAGDTMLANLANHGKGPRYKIINGRALYTREDLLAWINEQPVIEPRSRTSKATPSAVSTVAPAMIDGRRGRSKRSASSAA